MRYEATLALRKYWPGFRRIGAPIHIGDTYGPKEMRDKKTVLIKSKNEIVEEHGHVMHNVYQRTILSVAVAAGAIFAFFEFMTSGSDFYLFATIGATAYAMYKWWHAAAAYSNYQQLEFRPLIVPIEDLREPNKIPFWLSGDKPTFKAGAVPGTPPGKSD